MASSAPSAPGTWPAPASPPPRVAHPGLFVNSRDLSAVREAVERHAWARESFGRAQARAAKALEHAFFAPPTGWNRWERNWLHHDAELLRDLAIVAALTGDGRYAAKAVFGLVKYARKYPVPQEGEFIPMMTYGYVMRDFACAYDLLYETMHPDERAAVEAFLRRIVQRELAVIDEWLAARARAAAETSRPPSPGPAFHNFSTWALVCVGCAGLLLGEPQWVDWAIALKPDQPPELDLSFKGTIRQALWDGYWFEASIGYHFHALFGLATLAEAAHHSGIDLYRWRASNGNSLKDLFDSPLRLLLPDGSFPSFGDVDEVSYLRDWRQLYELAYRRYGDPVYGWVVSLGPRDARDQRRSDTWEGGVGDHYKARTRDPVEGLLAQTYLIGVPELGEIRPPTQFPCEHLPSKKMVLLRSQAPGAPYLGTPTVVAALKYRVGESHGHADPLALVLFGHGALLEPDWFVGRHYDPNRTRYIGVYREWTRQTVAHNTVVVDERSCERLEGELGLFETGGGPFDLRLAAAGGTGADGVWRERVLALLGGQLLDLYTVQPAAGRDWESHCYDWVLHGPGSLAVEGLALAPRPPFTADGYEWIRRVRAGTSDGPWRAVWRIRPERRQQGAAAGTVGVAVSVAGEPESEVFSGDGPQWATPDLGSSLEPGAVPLVIARRRATATTFVALHAPFRGRRPPRASLVAVSDASRDGGAVQAAIGYARVAGGEPPAAAGVHALFVWRRRTRDGGTAASAADAPVVVRVDLGPWQGEVELAGRYACLHRAGQTLAVQGDVRRLHLAGRATAGVETVWINGGAHDARSLAAPGQPRAFVWEG